MLAIVLIPVNDADAPSWVFPFDRPLPPGEGDNQALAVNTTDGTVIYDVAFALVWARDGSVLNSNEAYAFARCDQCASVAIGFQIIIAVGEVDVAIPENLAGAVNYACVSCVTYALAKQLVITLPADLSPEAMAQLDALWSEISQFGENVRGVPLSELQSRLEQFEQQILAIGEQEGTPAPAPAETTPAPESTSPPTTVAATIAPAPAPSGPASAPATVATTDPPVEQTTATAAPTMEPVAEAPVSTAAPRPTTTRRADHCHHVGDAAGAGEHDGIDDGIDVRAHDDRRSRVHERAGDDSARDDHGDERTMTARPQAPGTIVVWRVSAQVSHFPPRGTYVQKSHHSEEQDDRHRHRLVVRTRRGPRRRGPRQAGAAARAHGRRRRLRRRVVRDIARLAPREERGEGCCDGREEGSKGREEEGEAPSRPAPGEEEDSVEAVDRDRDPGRCRSRGGAQEARLVEQHESHADVVEVVRRRRSSAVCCVVDAAHDEREHERQGCDLAVVHRQCLDIAVLDRQRVDRQRIDWQRIDWQRIDWQRIDWQRIARQGVEQRRLGLVRQRHVRARRVLTRRTRALRRRRSRRRACRALLLQSDRPSVRTSRSR